MTDMNKNLAIAAFAAATALFAASGAFAQELPTAEETYREIEETLGTVPTHIKSYPKSAVSGAWAMFKGLETSADPALEPKVRSLINLAVAAQIPCQYCIWLETKMARANGATQEEIAEAVAHAGYVRHWSAVINGLQIDFETFKSEFGGD
jgi:AhpD family alkylhydroperoxidase